MPIPTPPGDILQRLLANARNSSKDIRATYVWIDADQGLRFKVRTLDFNPKGPDDLPVWNFDGSSTGQAKGENSDVYIRPVAVYKDPFFRPELDCLVMCETLTHEGKIHPTNARSKCAEVMKEAKSQHPWFGIEQEYTIIDPEDGRPFGWPKHGFPAPQGPYYCGVGASKMKGRPLSDAHYEACLLAGVKISGTNAEVMPSQWEFQVGPCEGVQMGDDLWMARFLLLKLAEDFGLEVSFDPKPIPGDWNGCGAHCNFSTKKMRQQGGIQEIKAAIQKLEKKHKEHIQVYDPNDGADNARRLVGALETSSLEKFSWGVADRGGSVRIPRDVDNQGKGYLEDRRPASNCDPYLVTWKIVQTTCLSDN